MCSHARAREAIAQCVKYGVDIIYHGSYIDEVTMDELEKSKSRHMVAPALNWLYATTYEAGPFGYSFDKAEQDGYKKELDVAIRVCKEMHQRGITVLPLVFLTTRMSDTVLIKLLRGGDYGFAWTPHGTYARDLEHFVKLLDFTPMEAILAATAGVAKLFMQENELGKVQPGYYADMILVDGNPLKDITILQDHAKLSVIMINGRIHKASPKDIDFASGTTTVVDSRAVATNNLTNYVTYLDDQGRSRVGHLDLHSSMVTPLMMMSGAPINSLYQVIELENAVIAYGDSFPLSSVSIQAPISDRDILAVGKNYASHAIEFNRSGYDSSDKTDQRKKNRPVPEKCNVLIILSATHPVIFSKRSTSILPCGEEIYPHPNYTSTLDYEGEIGVIIGKAGFQIAEKDAMDYVWGYTIINGKQSF